MGDGRQEPGNRRWEMGGDRGQETADRRQKPGDERHEMRGGRRKTEDADGGWKMREGRREIRRQDTEDGRQ